MGVGAHLQAHHARPEVAEHEAAVVGGARRAQHQPALGVVGDDRGALQPLAVGVAHHATAQRDAAHLQVHHAPLAPGQGQLHRRAGAEGPAGRGHQHVAPGTGQLELVAAVLDGGVAVLAGAAAELVLEAAQLDGALGDRLAVAPHRAGDHRPRQLVQVHALLLALGQLELHGAQPAHAVAPGLQALEGVLARRVAHRRLGPRAVVGAVQDPERHVLPARRHAGQVAQPPAHRRRALQHELEHLLVAAVVVGQLQLARGPAHEALRGGAHVPGPRAHGGQPAQPEATLLVGRDPGQPRGQARQLHAQGQLHRHLRAGHGLAGVVDHASGHGHARRQLDAEGLAGRQVVGGHGPQHEAAPGGLQQQAVRARPRARHGVGGRRRRAARLQRHAGQVVVVGPAPAAHPGVGAGPAVVGVAHGDGEALRRQQLQLVVGIAHAHLPGQGRLAPRRPGVEVVGRPVEGPGDGEAAIGPGPGAPREGVGEGRRGGRGHVGAGLHLQLVVGEQAHLGPGHRLPELVHHPAGDGPARLQHDVAQLLEAAGHEHLVAVRAGHALAAEAQGHGAVPQPGQVEAPVVAGGVAVEDLEHVVLDAHGAGGQLRGPGLVGDRHHVDPRQRRAVAVDEPTAQAPLGFGAQGAGVVQARAVARAVVRVVGVAVGQRHQRRLGRPEVAGLQALGAAAAVQGAQLEVPLGVGARHGQVAGLELVRPPHVVPQGVQRGVARHVVHRGVGQRAAQGVHEPTAEDLLAHGEARVGHAGLGGPGQLQRGVDARRGAAAGHQPLGHRRRGLGRHRQHRPRVGHGRPRAHHLHLLDLGRLVEQQQRGGGGQHQTQGDEQRGAHEPAVRSPSHAHAVRLLLSLLRRLPRDPDDR